METSELCNVLNETLSGESFYLELLGKEKSDFSCQNPRIYGPQSGLLVIRQ